MLSLFKTTFFAPKGRRTAACVGFDAFFCGSYSICMNTDLLFGYAGTVLEAHFWNEKKYKELLNKMRAESAEFEELAEDFSNKWIVEKLKSSHFCFFGTGSTPEDAIIKIMDQAAFWFLIENPKDEAVVKTEPEYYDLLLHPQKMDKRTRAVYEVLETAARANREVPAFVKHGKDTYQNYYVTMETLLKDDRLSFMKPREIYAAISQLYDKHCIYMTDKKPTHHYAVTSDEDFYEQMWFYHLTECEEVDGVWRA